MFSQKFFSLLLMMLIIAGCMPTSGTSPVKSANNSTSSTTSTATYSEPTFPFSQTFIQQGATQTTSLFTLPVNFEDSFLIRGKDLSVYLRGVPNSTKLCLVGKFNYLSGVDKFIVLSAKPKINTDLVNKTTEFYLQVEPANTEANQTDCLTYNLGQTLMTASSTTLSFNLMDVCSSCSTSVTSSSLAIYFTNGELASALAMNAITLQISGNSSSANSNSCVENSACLARGFDCCLGSQCVTDGSVKPSAILDPAFATAQEDVRLNPSRFVVYPQFYFVCNSVNTPNPGSGTSTNTGNPDYEAQQRLMEMTQYYDCLNTPTDEFSRCTIKFTNASKSIPGAFSGASLGYKDDINFSTLNSNLGSGDYANNITKVVYGGQALYESNVTSATGMSLGAANDNLTAIQSVNVTQSLPTTAPNDTLYLTYKVDGTCQKVGSTLARCTKSYVQGSSDTHSTKYHDTSKSFRLPDYADLTNYAVVVKINGNTVPEDVSTWTRTATPPIISFPSYPIYNGQTIEISYYTTQVSNLFSMRDAAQTAVNSMCVCGTSMKCNLRPLYDSYNKLVNYECTATSTTTTEPPTNQTVSVSNKNTPHRYYDSLGVNYDEDYATASAQEGTAFAYTNNDVLKPNNISSAIGFNEINGSFAKSGTYVATPAKVVRVKKDTTYDVVVKSGVFSTCLTCGSDYYNSLQKIFPTNYVGHAGGYSPDYYESRRTGNSGIYRGDDLLYGRACFVPATMIPWTHYDDSVGGSNVTQRRNRLAAQHFLFANGYNRDWYGFDYGSLIGSFDGVTWFSIGNQRRFKAKTGKLFLAVNSYYNDLNISNSFSVNIYETASGSSAIPSHDTESDGAECQKAHYCSTDKDCIATLGYDYACQTVSSVSTNWPIFDASGQEIVGSQYKSIATLVGGTNGQSKRCVYRGRGAPCHTSDLSPNNYNGVNGSNILGTLLCSPNNSCASLTSSVFNDRISRAANTPLVQNTAAIISPVSDIVGLGARILGRPFNFYGSSAPVTAAKTALNQNKVTNICVPGKDVTNSTSSLTLNSTVPASRAGKSDKILGVGPTMSLSETSVKQLSSCPAVDSNGLINWEITSTLDLSSVKYHITQNLSSNLLSTFSDTSIYNSDATSASQVTSIGYQRNSCLRAPGASCFSDLECAPSSIMASKISSSGTTNAVNASELKFWKEPLVCGNVEQKYTQPGVLNTKFNVKNNMCCREVGNTLTVATQSMAPNPDGSARPIWCQNDQVMVAGVTASTVSDVGRYSRVHTVFDKITCDPTKLTSGEVEFALSLEVGTISGTAQQTRFTQTLEQYKTLDLHNQRACCTKNWVRSFDSTNGGGHEFSRTIRQTIDPSTFKNISWVGNDNTVFCGTTGACAPTTLRLDTDFHCHKDNFNNSSCEIKNLTATEEKKYLEWIAALDLVGIPQVMISDNNDVYQIVDDTQITYVTKQPLKNTIVANTGSDHDFEDTAGIKYYSVGEMSHFQSNIKKIFSSDEFNCCLPSGKEVSSTTTASQCCTGFIGLQNNIRTCCLRDFTDLTVYLNRYVSSEGNSLPDSAYDPKTGYISDPGQVKQLALAKNLCCSGNVMTGVAISQLPIPINGLVNGEILPPDASNTSRRFTYYPSDSIVDNNTQTGSVGAKYADGVRWNNHVYCVPAGYTSN